MKNYIGIFFLTMLFACELIVDIEVPFDSPQITLNSFFNPDGVWKVNLTRNRHILNDRAAERINNALVIIHDETGAIDTLIDTGNGIYQSDSGRPKIGITYSIEAIAENLQTVKAKSIIPAPVQIISAEVTETLADNQYENKIKVKFRDPGAIKNFYQVFVDMEMEYYDYRTESINIQHSRVPLESDDPAIQNQNSDGNYYDGFIFNDILFDGKEIELSFRSIGFPLTRSGALILSLRSISEDYYKYKITSELQNNTSGDPFAQPVNVYNNIENGFGIFGGYSESTYIKSAPRPLINSLSSNIGKAGDHIILTGENFAADHLSVSFKGEAYLLSARIVRSSEEQIEVIVPENATTGKIVVSVDGRVGISDTDFEIIQ
jgi:hypothetical protein